MTKAGRMNTNPVVFFLIQFHAKAFLGELMVKVISSPIWTRGVISLYYLATQQMVLYVLHKQSTTLRLVVSCCVKFEARRRGFMSDALLISTAQ